MNTQTTQRETFIKISGRKVPGYPTLTFGVQFGDIEDFIIKVDKLIEGTNFGKVDVYIEDPDVFNSEEQSRLEKEWFIF